MLEIGNTLYLTLLIIISSLSLIGCLVLLVDYYYQRQNANLATRLLAILSISDAVYVIAVTFNPIPQTEDAFCVVQAVFKQFSSLSIFIVNFFFCLTTYLTIVKNVDVTVDNYEKYKRNLKVFSILFPFLIALIPLTYDGYGIQYYACAFKTQSSYWLGELLLFYIPFGFLFATSIVFLIKIQNFLTEIQQSKLDYDEYIINRRTLMSQNSQITAGEQYTKFLLYYTLIHFICWVPIIVSQILNILLIKDFLWFEGLSYIFACSQGFLDCFIFLISKKISSKTQNFEKNNSFQSADPQDIYRGSAVYNSSL